MSNTRKHKQYRKLKRLQRLNRCSNKLKEHELKAVKEELSDLTQKIGLRTHFSGYSSRGMRILNKTNRRTEKRRQSQLFKRELRQVDQIEEDLAYYDKYWK